MAENSLPFLHELEQRGIVKQITDPALASLLDTEKITLYAGFDPTADSLHVGSLLPLMTLRRFQLRGHRPILLIGGATGLIGDPSGKALERNLMKSEHVRENCRSIRTLVSRFLDVGGPKGALILDNLDWFESLSALDFLRDIGKHFTINHMMAKESVRSRLEDREHGISFTEFSYMLLQAHDFEVLNQNHGCRLQIGGSDQWGNITAGIELIRRRAAARSLASPTVFGLTHPLVTQSDGTKFGKTEQGTIWIDAKRTSPYQFHQFLIQTSDQDVISYLKYFTFLSLDEIQGLERNLAAHPEKREAQNRLASELTLLIHGPEGLAQAEKAASALFSDDLTSLPESTLLELFSGAPTTSCALSRLSSGIPFIELLVETGLCSSKGMARKEISAGGISLNQIRVTDPARVVQTGDLLAQQWLVLKKGKKNYHLIRFS